MELFAELFRIYKNKPMSLSIQIYMRGKEEEQPDAMTSLIFIF